MFSQSTFDTHLYMRDAKETRLDRNKVPKGIRRKMLALLNVAPENFESLKVITCVTIAIQVQACDFILKPKTHRSAFMALAASFISTAMARNAA